MNKMTEIVKIVTESMAHKKEMCGAPDGKLGVGNNPTPAEANERRELLVRMLNHLAGPLMRKANRANTTAKKWRLYKALRRHDSAAAYQVLCVIRGIQ